MMDLHKMRHPADGRVHLSELRGHAHCPAMVAFNVQHARELTRPMLVGGIADSLVFSSGKGHVLYPGPRRSGKEWEAFKAANPGKYLCIQSELDDATGAAEAVLANPIARKLLKGAEYQMALQWDAYGLPCASGIEGERGGFDVIGKRHYKTGRPYIADLKVTADTEPLAFSRHARKMHWPVQGKWFIDGAHAKNLEAESFHLIGVRATPPHLVTVLRVTPHELEIGGRLLTLWTERHRACEAAGVWPEYCQDEVDMIEDGAVEFEE